MSNLYVNTINPATGNTVTVAATETHISGNMIISGTLHAKLTDFVVSANSTTLGDASGDTIIINAGTVSIPNNLNFDSNTLVLDSSNNRVGIGTASPSEKVDVSLTGANGGIRVINATDNAYLKLDAPSDEAAYVDFSTGESNDWQIGRRPGSNDLTVYDNDGASNYIFTWQQGGNVGIGVTDPDELLEVAGDVKVSGANKLYFFDSGGEYLSSDGADLTIAAGTAINIAAGVLDLSAQTVDVTLNAAVDALNFDSNTLSIDASNNRVGIGTASPSSILHARLDGSGSLPSIDNDTIALFQRNLPGYSSAAITILGHVAGESIIKFGDTDDEDIGRIRYQHANNSMDFFTNNSETMTIDSSGNVGIGVTDPDAQLEVLSTSNQLKLSADSNSFATLAVASGGNSNLTVATAESGSITIDAAGDIELNADGGDIVIKDGSTTAITLDIATTSGDVIFKDAGSAELFRLDGNNNYAQAASGLKIGTGSVVYQVMDEDSMASNRDNALATQQSIKAYVDASATAQDLDLSVGGSSFAVDLDSQALTVTGAYGEIAATMAGQTLTLAFPNNVEIDDNLLLTSNSSVISFGEGADLTLTHAAGGAVSGSLTLNGSNKICFNDASQFIQGASATVMEIAATAEIGLTATLVDMDANLDLDGAANISGILTIQTGIIPSAQDGAYLGSSTKQWSDLYLADEAIIYFGDNNEVTLTHIQDTGLELVSVSATTSHLTTPLTITAQSTGTPNSFASGGFGPSIRFKAETAAGTPGNIEHVGFVGFGATDKTGGSEDFSFLVGNIEGAGATGSANVMTASMAVTRGGSATSLYLYNDDKSHYTGLQVNHSTGATTLGGGSGEKVDILGAGGAGKNMAVVIAGGVTDAATTGDATLEFAVDAPSGQGGATQWSIGCDGSDSDKFKIVTGSSSALNTAAASYVELSSAGAVFNEGAVAAFDFRVEGDNDTHLLFVDAGSDAVSIGVSTDAPAAVLELVGDSTAAKPTLSILHAEDTNNAVDLTADALTTAVALNISTDARTTGTALDISDSATGDSAGSLVKIAQVGSRAGSAASVGLDIDFNTVANANARALRIDSEQTTGIVAEINGDAIDTGAVIDISADGLTTGTALYVDMDSSNTGQRSAATILSSHHAAHSASVLVVHNNVSDVTGSGRQMGFGDLVGAVGAGVGGSINFQGNPSLKIGTNNMNLNMYQYDGILCASAVDGMGYGGFVHKKTVSQVSGALNFATTLKAVSPWYSGGILKAESGFSTEGTRTITLPTATNANYGKQLLGWTTRVIYTRVGEASVAIVRGDTSNDSITGLITSAAADSSAAAGITISSHVITFVGGTAALGDYVDVTCTWSDASNTLWHVSGMSST